MSFWTGIGSVAVFFLGLRTIIRMLNDRNESKQAVPQIREPSVEEVQRCVDLIRANRFAGPKEQVDPFRVTQMSQSQDSYRSFLVEFEDPGTLAEGTIYREWIVIFPLTGEPQVVCGRARRRGGGCDTLPPEGWDD